MRLILAAAVAALLAACAAPAMHPSALTSGSVLSQVPPAIAT